MKIQSDFYNLLAVESGINDLSAVKQVYHGLNRLIGKKLRTEGKIELPEIGEMRIRPCAEHMLRGQRIPASKKVMFVFKRSFKDRVKNW